MNKTKIEWCDFTWNPIKGMCQFGCPYCYARRLYQRFKLDPKPTLDTNELNAVMGARLPKGSKIFVCSTHELFGGWIPDLWRVVILSAINHRQDYNFLILTKNPEKAIDYTFPDNCWVGTSIESDFYMGRLDSLKEVRASVKFISFEPLLGEVTNLDLKGIEWVIVGGLSGERNKEKLEQRRAWAKNIIAMCQEQNVPVFVKDNLKMKYPFREFPDVSARLEYI